jgi:hypothetical protein
MNVMAILEDIEIVNEQVKRVHYSVRASASREIVAMVYGHVKGGDFFVDDFVGPGKGHLGARAVREIVRQLKRDFPSLDHLRGPRLTGARMAAGVVDGGGHARF